MNDGSTPTRGRALPVYRKVLHNFVLMTDRALLRLGEILSLSMTLPELVICRNYYKIDQKRNPTEEELRMLDGLCAASKQQTRIARLRELSSDNEELLATYRDLRAKEAALSRPNNRAETPAQIAQIASLYHTMIGRIPTEQSVFAGSFDGDRNALYIRDADGRAVAHLGQTAETKAALLPTGLALCLVTPADASVDEERYREAASQKDESNTLRTCVPVGEDGLLGAFLKHTGGCYADLSLLPDREAFLPEDENADTGIPLLTVLTEGYHGMWLWAVAQSDMERVRGIASERGLRAAPIATCTASGRMILAKTSNPYLNCSFAFLRDLCKYGSAVSAFCTDRNPHEPARRLPLIACHGSLSEEHGIPVTAPLRHGARLVLPLASEFRGNAFYHAMDLVADALLGLCARGADRRHVTLSVLCSFPEKSECTSFSNSIAALLGLYRAEIELSLPELHSSAEYHEGEGIRLACAANSPLPKQHLPSVLQSKGSKLYLLPLRDLEGGLPDFAALRTLCDQARDLIRRGDAVSSLAFTGSVAEAVASMEGSLRLSFAAEADMSEVTRGILIESEKTLPFLLVGQVT